MKPKPDLIRIHVSLTEEQLRKIDAIAIQTNRTRSDVLRLILEDYLNAQ